MKFAILDASNIVINIIEGDKFDDTFIAAFPAAVELKSPGGMGSHYDGANFNAPPVVTPQTERSISASKYLQRFTQTERLAIRGSTDPIVADFIGLAQVTPMIFLDDPLTIGGTQYLEAHNLIGVGRAAQILA